MHVVLYGESRLAFVLPRNASLSIHLPGKFISQQHCFSIRTLPACRRAARQCDAWSSFLHQWNIILSYSITWTRLPSESIQVFDNIDCSMSVICRASLDRHLRLIFSFEWTEMLFRELVDINGEKLLDHKRFHSAVRKREKKRKTESERERNNNNLHSKEKDLNQ